MALASGISRTLMVAGAALLASNVAAAPFDGPYVGAQLGWQQNKSDMRLARTGNPVVADTVKSNGLSYGGFLGYNAKLGESFVLGVEGGVSSRTGSAKRPGVRVKPGVRWDLAARAGVLATPETLVYARGGYTNQRFKTSVTGFLDQSKSRNGWTIGAGVEQAVMENVTARVEYDYARYGSFRHAEFGGSWSQKPKTHAVRVGAAYNF